MKDTDNELNGERVQYRIANRGRAEADYVDKANHINNRSNYIGYGLIVLCYSLFLSGDPDLRLTTESVDNKIYSVMILVAGLAGVLTVIFDYLQFILGYWASRRAADASDRDYLHDPNWFTYKYSFMFFKWKQYFAITGALIILSGIGFQITGIL